MKAAFISKGRLFVLMDDGTTKEIESPFALKRQTETEMRRSTSPWQGEGGGGMWGGFSIWGARGIPRAGDDAYIFTDVAKGKGSSIFYGLRTFTVMGLFEYDLTTGEERRIFHRNDFRFSGIDCDPEGRQFVVARFRDDGAMDIDLLDQNGRSLKVLTGGDSVDGHPRFSKSHKDDVLFQSCGIARNNAGAGFWRGPSSVNRINVVTGEMSEILADSAFDYLLPREDSAGTVYCIRRPYKVNARRPLGRDLLEFLFFPFRFAHAFYSFCRAFSEMFNNPATLADGPRPNLTQQEQYVEVLGQMLDVGKARRVRGQDEPSLVPHDWELLRIRTGQQPETLAKGVCSFDLNDADSVIFTNGFRIHAIRDREKSPLGKFELVEQLRC